MRVLQVGESLAVEYGGTAAACAELNERDHASLRRVVQEGRLAATEGR